MKNRKIEIITFPIADYKKEIRERKIITAHYHVSVDGENDTVTLTLLKKK